MLQHKKCALLSMTLGVQICCVQKKLLDHLLSSPTITFHNCQIVIHQLCTFCPQHTTQQNLWTANQVQQTQIISSHFQQPKKKKEKKKGELQATMQAQNCSRCSTLRLPNTDTTDNYCSLFHLDYGVTYNFTKE